jgi:tRNA(Ile)-lysidine synthase
MKTERKEDDDNIGVMNSAFKWLFSAQATKYSVSYLYNCDFVFLNVMQTQFLNHISRHNLCAVQDRILVAVSGGVDSVVLLRLLNACGYTVSIAHVNFQLRGSESDGDEHFVISLGSELGIPVFSTRVDTTAYAQAKGVSTQMAARDLRYEWFHSLMKTHGFDRLATGHHADDNAETILLNFAYGKGVDGYAGIPVHNGSTIRPLLFASRKMIESFAIEQGWSWRTDVSNLSDDYQRNTIRHHILPVFKDMIPGFESNIELGLTKAHQDINLLGGFISQWKCHYVKDDGNTVVIRKIGFDGITEPVALLWRLIKSFGFNRDQCVQIIARMNGQSGKVFLSGNYSLVIDRDSLIVSNTAPQSESSVTIARNQIEIAFRKKKLRIHQAEKVSFGKSPSEISVDASRLRFPLVWRVWQPGDYFYPLGMHHKRKVSDYLIDQKIPLSDKQHITVLESGGDIIWVVGMRLDDRFKITETTKFVVVFEYI